MTRQYSSYQLRALQQLADFRSIFYDEGRNVRTAALQKSINSFVELFCQHNFADSDYSAIQKMPEKFVNAEQWIDEFDVDKILKSLTYYIWTNKSNNGYLIQKIKDKTIHKHLVRLDNILSDQNKQPKVQNSNIVVLNPPLKSGQYKH